MEGVLSRLERDHRKRHGTVWIPCLVGGLVGRIRDLGGPLIRRNSQPAESAPLDVKYHLRFVAAHNGELLWYPSRVVYEIVEAGE